MLIAPATWSGAYGDESEDAALTGTGESLGEVIPLTFAGQGRHRSGAHLHRMAMAGALAVSLALVIGWIVAEYQLVTDAAWAHWDLVWIASAAGTVAAGIGWTVYLVRSIRR
jgi:hypothetical protein